MFGTEELAQYGAVGIALAIVSVGGFVTYKLGMALVDAAKIVLTNHLHHLTDEISGMRSDVGEGFLRIEAALRQQESDKPKKG